MAASVALLPAVNLLEDAQWECAGVPPGDGGLDPRPPDAAPWMPAFVPGTAAQSLAATGDPGALLRNFDASDWWYRCRLPQVPAGRYVLRFEGLATIADGWLGDHHLLHTENMFTTHEVILELDGAAEELVLRFASLSPLLAVRRTRPRWKCADLNNPNLRWIRTALVGRLTGGVSAPAPVGPWRPVSLESLTGPRVVRRRAHTTLLEGNSGKVDFEVELTGIHDDDVITVTCAGVSTVASVQPVPSSVDSGSRHVARGSLTVPGVRPWWPHTLGDQPLYELVIAVNDQEARLARVGFRTIEVDRSDGAFSLSVNGTGIFARGAVWTPLDPVSLQASPSLLRSRLELLKEGNHTMVRVAGTGVYESDEFYDLCDELGLLVWQDCMLAFFDAPDTDEFADQVRAEVTELLERLQGRPCLAVLCGGSENEQQAAYLGLAPESWPTRVAEEVVPDVLADLVPGVVYVRSTPGESPLPSMVNQGPSHYFGVGAYLKPLEDARRAGVRFASECLSFANPPEPLDTMEGVRAIRGLGHRPDWKEAVHRDSSTYWDLEDVRDLYTTRLFGIDPTALRRDDGERAAQVARATVATVFEAVLSEWRGPTSPCRGALVLQATDPRFGGGLGMIDSLGRPKSSWYVMRRIMQPAVVLLSDEGVNGLQVHVVSDRTEPWTATVQLVLLIDGVTTGDSTLVEVKVVDGHGSVDTATVFGGFRDLAHAHRFGPPAYDVVVATLVEAGDDAKELSQAVFLPGREGGRGLRDLEPDLGLRAVVRRAGSTAGPASGYEVEVTTKRFAQWVSLEVEGYVALDSWFHLRPGASVRVPLVPLNGSADAPRGLVRAMNSSRGERIEMDKTDG